MEYKNYETQKKEFDDVVMTYMAKRIFTEIDSSPAFINGVTDAMGNVINKSNGWDFTNLDRFIIALKQRLGQENLRGLLEVYSVYSDVDDLSIIKSAQKPITNKSMDSMKRIVSKVESLLYLDDVREQGDYFASEDHEDLEGIDNRISWALTVCTFMLYALRLDRVPTSIEFESNIIPSVEITFYVSAFKDYGRIVDFITKTDLIDDGKASRKCVRALVSVAKDIVDGKLHTSDGSRIEDQSRNWRKLSERG